MSDVILFRGKAELTAKENLAGFVESCRNQLTIFGRNLCFDSNVWDITDYINLKGHGGKRTRVVFSSFDTVDMLKTLPMTEPFLGFAKAYFRYMHGFRPVLGFGPRLTALRALEKALLEQGEQPSLTNTDSHVFNRAAQLVLDRYTYAVAYRVGGQLELITSFLTENKLTSVPVHWRNPIKRPGDTVRVGKEFDQRRQQKMPSEAALAALPKVFRLATAPIDVIVSSVAAILCAAPNRISEMLLLPENCEVRQKAARQTEGSYGLRWWPAKGADPMVKWILPSMASVVKEAIEKIRAVTEPARKVAKWYENNPRMIYLDGHYEFLRSYEWLSLEDVADIIGFANKASVRQWCVINDIREVGNRGHRKVRFVDVEKVVLAMLPRGFPLLEKEAGLKYSEALLLVRINEFHEQSSPYRCMFEPISINQINTGLGGRVAHGFPSVFSRLGFTEPDGTQIKVSTHQFRHYLNTLAQAGGLSQLDIAKWSGRRDIHQNTAYDHVTPDQLLQKIRDAVGDESQMFGPLAELPKRLPIMRDEFARLKVPTAHTTDLGFCIHDYTMSPCQLHRDCIHCEDLVCVKGDTEKAHRLRLALEEARDLQGRAKNAVSEGYTGSDRWLEHQNATVDRLSQLCSIMDDPKVPVGSVIQLAPPKTSKQVEESAGNQLLLHLDDLNADAGLLAEVAASLGT